MNLRSNNIFNNRSIQLRRMYVDEVFLKQNVIALITIFTIKLYVSSTVNDKDWFIFSWSKIGTLSIFLG